MLEKLSIRIKRKFHWIRCKLYCKRLQFRYRDYHFQYNGEVLSPRIEMPIEKGANVTIENIWGGAGHVRIGVNASGSLHIGSDVCINSNFFLQCRDRIEIGNDTMFGPNVVVIDHDHNYRSAEWKDEYKTSPIFIGNNVWIGANVTILRGTYIGDRAVIGAGMVCKGQYDADTVYHNNYDVVSHKFIRAEE